MKNVKHPLSLIVRGMILLATGLSVGILLYMVVHIAIRGIPYLSPDLFSWEYTSNNVSLLPSLINTLIMTTAALVLAVPIGILAAVYLVEYAKAGSRLVRVIRMTAETLSGIPSIVYGLFGMLLFVNAMHLGLSMISGALTLAIMILPLVMRTTEEALQSVPDMYREGSYGLGAGKVRTIFCILIPSATPGILSGVILATGRVVGETAALIYTAGTATKVFSGKYPWLSSGRTLSVHMYSLSKEGLHVNQAYATAVVLLILVIIMNLLSGFIAGKIKK